MNGEILTVLLISSCFLTFSIAFPATINGRDDGLGDTELISTNQPFDLVNNHNGFGIGAAAGIGGLGASAGLGSFHVDPKGDPFLPFGAFAGINLPNQAGRIGAGCTGLNCGVQLGEFVLSVPNLLSAASNLSRLQSSSFSDAVGLPRADDSSDNKTQVPNSIIRTRIDGRPNTVALEQGQNLFQTLLGGLRDFRTTLAGFFREPERSSIRAGLTSTTTTSSTTAPSTNTENTNKAELDPVPNLIKIEVSENEVVKT